MNKYQLAIIEVALSRLILQWELNLVEISEDNNMKLTDVKKLLKVVSKQLEESWQN